MAEAMPFPKTALSHNAKADSLRLTAQGGRSRILAAAWLRMARRCLGTE